MKLQNTYSTHYQMRFYIPDFLSKHNEFLRFLQHLFYIGPTLPNNHPMSTKMKTSSKCRGLVSIEAENSFHSRVYSLNPFSNTSPTFYLF